MADTGDSTAGASAEEPRVERPEVVPSGLDGGTEPTEQGDGTAPGEVAEPAKVMRVGTMIKQLLEEVRSSGLDEPSRDRLRTIYETSVRELSSALSPDLRDELDRLTLPFDDDATPSENELRIAQAQLVGWLEGLFHGIQATLFAQQMAARQQLERMRGQLPPGAVPPGVGGAPPAGDAAESRPGTYL